MRTHLAPMLGAAACLWMAACVVKFDYEGAVFTCETSEVCPGDAECINGVCVDPASGPADAGDADAAVPDAGAPDGPLTVKIQRTIAASADDVEEDLTTNVVDVPSDDLELVVQANVQVIGLRFLDVQIPQGATIVSASIQFEVDEATSEATELAITAEAVDDALVFTDVASNVSSRTSTTASVAWTPAAWVNIDDRGDAQKTPGIESVVQEIVSRPGWASGNALAILVNGTGKRVASSFDSVEPRQPAELTVEFIPPQ